MKLAILGEKKSIIGFNALGVETFGIATKQDMESAADQIEKQCFAILFVTEEIAAQFQETLEKFYQKTLPAILIIPGVQKAKKGKQALRKIVERALGSEMIKI